MLYRKVMENTPIGKLTLCADDNYIIRLDFDKPVNPEADAYIAKYYPGQTFVPGSSPELDKAICQLEEYFAGKRKSFELQMKLFGTDFYKACWHQLLEIPYGETISYKQLAQRVGSPKAFRAVGQANHNNPIAVIIPCHRVLAADGGLGGFGGGLETKKKLLDLENRAK